MSPHTSARCHISPAIRLRSNSSVVASTATSVVTDLDLGDARWFAVDLDVVHGLFHLLRVDEMQIEDASFLDNRLLIDWTQATLVPAEVVPSRGAVAAWLWHTSFCGSTLLARMLHVQPHSVALREPLILRRLSDARQLGRPFQDFIVPSVRLLSRAWHQDGHVVIKPTHAALNVAAELMMASPGSRGLLLTSSLEDFVVSHLKKQQQTLQRIPLLAERALSASGFAQRLDPAALNPPDLLCGAALQWAAQREVAADLLIKTHGRLLPVHWETLQRDPVDCAQRCAEWLQLSIPEDELAAHAHKLAGVHAKVPGRRYDAHARQAEARALASRYASEVANTLAWASRYLQPKMREFALTLDGSGPGALAETGA
jgi:hypothetical protein